MKKAQAETKHLGDYLSDMKNRIQYLNESPTGLITTLEGMLKVTPKIDEATGKVSEKYIKMKETLTELQNMTFNRLSKQMEDLGKAAQAGFIDPKILEKQRTELLAALFRDVTAEVEKEFDSTGLTPKQSGQAKEALRKERLVERGSAIGDPEFVKMLKAIVDKMPDPKSGYSARLTEKGTLKTEKQETAWASDALKASVAPVTDGLKKVDDSLNKNTNALTKTETIKTQAPAQAGTIPSQQFRDVARREGTTELASMTANTTALQSLVAEAKGLAMRLTTHGTKIDAQIAAMDKLTTAIANEPKTQQARNSLTPLRTLRRPVSR
jgi:hypothetical protein